jgi:hypothetical protein
MTLGGNFHFLSPPLEKNIRVKYLLKYIPINQGRALIKQPGFSAFTPGFTQQQRRNCCAVHPVFRVYTRFIYLLFCGRNFIIFKGFKFFYYTFRGVELYGNFCFGKKTCYPLFFCQCTTRFFTNKIPTACFS